ncbi:hypothetical protein [Xanthobacter sp. VNH20]|uniref:hypothetical protein n=1 Tax=Xanthobacter sp. VNH20 TaxID=3156616 RepID=UPI0032B3EEF1
MRLKTIEEIFPLPRPEHVSKRDRARQDHIYGSTHPRPIDDGRKRHGLRQLHRDAYTIINEVNSIRKNVIENGNNPENDDTMLIMLAEELLDTIIEGKNRPLIHERKREIRIVHGPQGR